MIFDDSSRFLTESPIRFSSLNINFCQRLFHWIDIAYNFYFLLAAICTNVLFVRIIGFYLICDTVFGRTAPFFPAAVFVRQPEAA